MSLLFRVALAFACILTAPVLGDDLKLEHRPPSLVQGQDAEFTARLPGVQSVVGNLYWRPKGEENFRRVQMTQSGPLLMARLPASKLQSDIEYYISVFYGGGLDREVTFHDTSEPQRLVLAKPTPPTVPSEALAMPKPDDSRSGVALPVAVLGGAVVAGVVGTVFGLQAKSNADDMNTASTQAAYATAKSAADSSATKATVAWITAGVLAAAGTALLIRHF